MEKNYPCRDECIDLLLEYKTPEHIIKHCKKVAEVALTIASTLNSKGYSLNLDLIQAAGLIHDIARVEDKHWEIGSKIASDLGYNMVAEIIQKHMFYASDPNKESIEEIDIICLSDRMVKEDQYVGLETRMKYVLDKFKDDPQAFERIKEKMKENQYLIEKIEKVIGTTIDSIMK